MTGLPPLDLAATADPRIEGRRLYLRRLRVADVSEAYLAWMNAPEINRYLESRFTIHTADDLAAFVESMAHDPRNLFTGIFLKADDRHIGNIKLGPINAQHARAEIGLLIGDSREWGKGYAEEAISAITRFAFEKVGLHRVIAGAYAENAGSARAFEKAGFTLEARLRDHWYHDGRYQDGVYLAKVNDKPS